MTRRLLLRLAGFVLLAMPGLALAEPVALTLKLVDEADRPLARLPVRVAIGSDAAITARDAGRRLTSSAQGVIVYRVEADIATRTISSTSASSRHPAEHVVVGVELELLGRRALYKVFLDQTAGGTVGQMVAYLPAADGNFTAMLRFHAGEHSWSLPDGSDGRRLSGIGAELKAHAMTGTTGKGRAIGLTIVKQSFRQR